MHAAEIQNRIRKIKQLELSPLIDNYGSLNAPHAHPSGLLNGLNNSYGQRFETLQQPSQADLDLPIYGEPPDPAAFASAGQPRGIKRGDLANIMKMDRLFPININYQNQETIGDTTA